jgi:hypothetical protein
MKGQTRWRLMRRRRLLVVCGGVLLIVSLLGLTGWALASGPVVRIHVDSGRLTAQLTQVPLRAVLGQLHDQLGIDYVAPHAELGKVISVTLQQEPLSGALSKILAPWDYAFTLNAAGQIKTLYVMAKVSPESSLADTRTKSGGPVSSEQKVSELQRLGRRDHESGVRHEEPLTKKDAMPGLSTRERAEASGKMVASMAVPMEIRPPADGTSMPVLPANRKDMRITPGGSARAMEIIPPGAYSSMNIQPVSEHVQQEMLLSLSP